ncbi:MAG: TetR/AcrR family transcriptional regulator [Pseudomonadota bacterium]
MSTEHQDKPRRIRRTPEQARAEILGAAERLLNTHALTELRVEDLMSEAGMTRSAFYHYFADLNSVARGLLDRIEADIMEWVEAWVSMPTGEAPAASGESAMRTVMEMGVQIFHQHRVLLTAIYGAVHADTALRSHWKATIFEPFLGPVTDLVTRQKQAGLVDVVDPRATVEALLMMNERVLIERVPQVPEARRPLVADTIFQIWHRALYGRSSS